MVDVLARILQPSRFICCSVSTLGKNVIHSGVLDHQFALVVFPCDQFARML